MTREAFIEELKGRGYSYEIKRDRIVVTYEGTVSLTELTSLPPGVEFRNEAGVYLESLTSLPPGVVFNNEAGVDLRSLNSISRGVVFKNGGSVNLKLLTGGWFWEWKGNIKGIDEKRLLNKMIKDGVFER
jgi:hypothetical protein